MPPPARCAGIAAGRRQHPRRHESAVFSQSFCTEGASIDPQSSLESISQAWGEKSKAGTLTPYLDWATPTMGDTLFGGLQQLSEGKVTPDQFAAAVQKDWEKAHS